jgi:hypothetical protein
LGSFATSLRPERNRRVTAHEFTTVRDRDHEVRLVTELVGRARLMRTDQAACPYGMYYVEATSEFGILGRTVELEVFWDQFGNDRELLASEYGPYNDSSTYILLIDHQESLIAGMVRIIEDSDLGLKTLHEIERAEGWQKSFDDIRTHHDLAYARSDLWDVAGLAVRHAWRAHAGGGMVSVGLYHGVVIGALLAGKQGLVAALDDVVADLMIAFGSPWERVCGLPSIAYEGSPATSPMIIPVPSLRRTLGEASKVGRMICYGEGFEGLLSIPTISIDRGPMSPVEVERLSQVPLPAKVSGISPA